MRQLPSLDVHRAAVSMNSCLSYYTADTPEFAKWDKGEKTSPPSACPQMCFFSSSPFLLPPCLSRTGEEKKP